MKESPDMFHALELEYIINGQRSSRRRVAVTGSSLTAGRLFTRLQNMPETGDDNAVRFVTSSDLKTVAAETTSKVVASVTTDSDYIDTGDDVSVFNLLERVLGRQEVSTANFQPHMWNSVFWDPSWARPDKIASYLNKALSKDATDSRNFILTEEAESSSKQGSAGGSFLKIFSVKGSGGSENNQQRKVQKEDVLNVLRERHTHVEWTGDVFRVKPMKLFRLNLSALNTSTSIAVANLQVHR